ncbi:alkaline ceramidase 3 [Nilaparvata lugens]|uniref:alkaline ceramidase 3 n=1 Tax=Nilaparvata lugens TaxID=108931 RepID=UPI00193EA243|nr:alkaline ceramidase 3 [Nilaparvata lugens]
MAPHSEIIGYWGPPTATIDWCEKNYEVNFYVAEMSNTISNLMMILPPIWGMVEVINQGFELRFIFCHFLLLVVGLGSWAFHMTLLYEMQLFDELPMVWGTCVLVYCLAVVKKPENDKMFSNGRLAICLVTFASSFTAVYLLWPQPLLQHSSYGVLVLISFAQEINLIRLKGCQVCKKLFIISLTTYLLGFFLWNLDKIFCSNLHSLRSSMSPYLSPVTQLHGWWHCFAGYATYLQVFICIHSNYDFKKSKKEKRKLELCQMGFGLRWFKPEKSR